MTAEERANQISLKHLLTVPVHDAIVLAIEESRIAAGRLRPWRRGDDMTEREAWLRLAEDIVARVLRDHGLCNCLYWMRHNWSEIDHATYQSMKLRILELPSYNGSPYKWALSKAGDEQRAAFCRAQAAALEKGTVTT